MARSAKERVNDARRRKEAAGLRQVNVWVPADQVERIKQIAADLVAGDLPSESIPVDTVHAPSSPPEPVAGGNKRVCYGIVFAFPYKPVSRMLRAELLRKGFENEKIMNEWWGSIFPDDYRDFEKLITENGGVILNWRGANP